MKSELPKVLVPVRGRPMIEYVFDAIGAAGVDQMIAVVGYRAADVEAALAHRSNVTFVQQPEQLGTGHAVMCCRERLASHVGPVLVVAGDAPLMQADSVAALFDDFHREPAACILGTARKDDPTGLGRIVRDASGRFVGIVEQRDATPDEQRITEVNMSYYLFHGPDLLDSLEKIRANNSQREYYLTDCPGVLASEGKQVRALCVLKPFEALGINTVQELSAVESAMDELGLFATRAE